MEKETLASEMLGELKRNCRRWFVACIVLIGVLLATNAIWVWYITLPVNTSTTTTQEADGQSSCSYIGGNYVGTTDSN